MKELSIEEKARAYDEKVSQAKEMLKDGTISQNAINYIQHLFPELKESEDERIRNFLISKMKEVGNVWKEYSAKDIIAWLEKQGEQKPAWSEEDNRKIKFLVNLVNEWCDKAPNATSMVKEEMSDWLKSLKDRYTWKPSDEQMEQLGWIAEQNKDNMIGKELMTLYNDLKKLKE